MDPFQKFMHNIKIIFVIPIMSLIETIQDLSTIPRHKDDEYEYTSDFLEWFYYNIYREQIDNYTILQGFEMEPEYEYMLSQCQTLIDINNAKNFNDETLVNIYNNMKQWTIDNIKKYV